MQEVRQQLETALTPRQRGWLWPSVAATVAAIVGVSAWWWIAPGPNPEAYEQLLRGRFEMWRYTPESSENAAANFTKALQKDPQYAEAAAELANTLRRGGLAGVREPMQALREAEVEARRAIALNDALPQAHTVLADVLRDQWKWQDAMTIYNQTVARFPDYIPAHVSRALELSVLGDRAEATRELLKMETLARQQDAVGHSIVIDLAAGFYNVKDFTRALSILDAAARNDDYAPALKAWTGQVYGAMGRFDKALENLTKAKERGDNTLGTWCYLVYALARTHDRPGALQLLDEIRSSPNYLAASSLAIAYVGIREYEQALTALETAYMKHDPLLPYIVVEWYLDPIRDDPRFRRIVAGMGIPVS